MRRQATEILLQHRDISNRLGLMTSQLLATPNGSESARIMAQHLPQLGVQRTIVVVYTAKANDPLTYGTVLLDLGAAQNCVGWQFPSHEFPPPGLYPPGAAFQLALLPLTIDERAAGFVALSALDLEPCAAIVHNLAS